MVLALLLRRMRPKGFSLRLMMRTALSRIKPTRSTKDWTGAMFGPESKFEVTVA